MCSGGAEPHPREHVPLKVRGGRSAACRALALRLLLLVAIVCVSGSSPWSHKSPVGDAGPSPVVPLQAPAFAGHSRLLAQVGCPGWCCLFDNGSKRCAACHCRHCAAAAAAAVQPHPSCTTCPSCTLQEGAPPEPAMATFSQAVLLPPNGTADGVGSVLMPGLAPTGTMLGAAADNVVASAGDCCRACRANKRCTAMWFCEAQVCGMRQCDAMIISCAPVVESSTVHLPGRPPAHPAAPPCCWPLPLTAGRLCQRSPQPVGALRGLPAGRTGGNPARHRAAGAGGPRAWLHRRCGSGRRLNQSINQECTRQAGVRLQRRRQPDTTRACT